jgi:hypothetical protein
LIFVLLVPKGIAPVISERLVPWVMSLRRPPVPSAPDAAPHDMPQGSRA